MIDPNLHNPAFIHGFLSLMSFDLAACIVTAWLTYRKDGK